MALEWWWRRGWRWRSGRLLLLHHELIGGGLERYRKTDFGLLLEFPPDKSAD